MRLRLICRYSSGFVFGRVRGAKSAGFSVKVWKTRCFFAASGENILPTGLRPIGRAAAGGCGAGGAKTRKGGGKVMELVSGSSMRTKNMTK